MLSRLMQAFDINPRLETVVGFLSLPFQPKEKAVI